MSEVASELCRRCERPCFAVDGGIAEEVISGIDAESLASAEGAIESAFKCGCAVIGAGTIGKLAAFDATVIEDAGDGADRSGRNASNGGLVADESGSVLVKVWGSRATELLRGQ